MRQVRTRRRGGSAARGPVPQVGRGTDARAWCGPGHGLQWELPGGVRPPDLVELATEADGDWSYRLVLHPATSLPAHDHQGRLVYLPVARVPSEGRE